MPMGFDRKWLIPCVRNSTPLCTAATGLGRFLDWVDGDSRSTIHSVHCVNPDIHWASYFGTFLWLLAEKVSAMSNYFIIFCSKNVLRCAISFNSQCTMVHGFSTCWCLKVKLFGTYTKHGPQVHGPPLWNTPHFNSVVNSIGFTSRKISRRKGEVILSLIWKI